MIDPRIRDKDLYFGSNEGIFPLAIQARAEEKPKGTLVAIAGGMDGPLLLTAMQNPRIVRFVDADARQLKFAERKYHLACEDFSTYRRIFLGFTPVDLEELKRLFPEEEPGFLSKLQVGDEKKSPISLRESYGSIFDWFGGSPFREAGGHAGLRNWERLRDTNVQRSVSFVNISLLASGVVSGEAPLVVYFSNVLDYLNPHNLDQVEEVASHCDTGTVFYDASNIKRSTGLPSTNLRRYSKEGFIERIRKKEGLHPSTNKGQI